MLPNKWIIRRISLVAILGVLFELIHEQRLLSKPRQDVVSHLALPC